MELRVHGVGGPSPQSVMGCRDDEPAVTTWRSEPGAFTAVRRSPIDSDVLAYDWRPLTSGSKAFALWPVLLPYCLLNIAGWMRPRRGAVLGGATRIVTVLIGYAATVATVVWLLFAGQVLTHAPGVLDDAIVRRFPGSEDLTRWWLGIAASIGAVVLVLLASVHVGRGLDRYRPTVDGAVAPHPPAWRVWSRSMPDLSSPVFFDTARDHRRRWRTHAALVAATAIGVIVLVVVRGADEPFGPLGDAVVWIGGAQVGLLVVGVVLSIGRGGTWVLAAASTAAIGTMLIGGLTLSGLMLVTSMEALPAGPALMAFDAFGLALVVGALVAIGCVVRRLLMPVGDEGSSLASSAARRWARIARLTDDVGLVLTAVGLTFVVASAVLFPVRYWGDDRSTWRLTGNPLVTAGRAALFVVLTFMVLNLVKARANPEALRRVGRVWDVICFWPRTFHPFAVRPYAERAVPELRELMARRGWSHGLQVTAHSQGAVLAYAALLPDAEAAVGAPLAPASLGVVTFGCPLRTIYARAFPSQIDVGRFDVVRAYLGGRWENVFRYTDPVGRTVFSEPGRALDRGDLVVVDPAPGSKRVMGHDGYWTIPVVRDVVTGWGGP
jgi:hypothetical protein